MIVRAGVRNVISAVYDFVDLPTLRNAVALLETDTDAAPTPRQIRRRNGLKKAA